MTRECLDVLVTKARTKIQAVEAIAHLQISKFSFQRTVPKVRFRASRLVSAPETHPSLFQGKDVGFQQLRMWRGISLRCHVSASVPWALKRCGVVTCTHTWVF